MSDPTPERAPDAVPEAVYNAVAEYARAAFSFGESTVLTWDRRAAREADRAAQDACYASIATTLREATADRDQEITRLKNALREYADIATARAALVAARAAGEDGQ